MKASPKKFQFLIFDKTPRQPIMLNINQIGRRISNSSLLSVTIDNRLILKDHVDISCSIANYKLHTWTRIKKYLNLERAKLL